MSVLPRSKASLGYMKLYFKKRRGKRGRERGREYGEKKGRREERKRRKKEKKKEKEEGHATCLPYCPSLHDIPTGNQNRSGEQTTPMV